MKCDRNLHGPRLKTSSVKKYTSEQFRAWKDLDRETIFVYSNSF